MTGYFQPFLNDRLMRLNFSLGLCFFTFWTGSMLVTDPKCGSGNGLWCAFAAFVVADLNIIGAFGLLFIFGTSFWQEKDPL